MTDLLQLRGHCMWAVILVLIAIHAANGLDPSKILVSLTIDAHNNEIVYEGLRLLASLTKFGGQLAQAKLEVCVATRNRYEHPSLMKKLKTFNISYLRYCQRMEGHQTAKSLNKLCSFQSPHLAGMDYFLYLDDDIFIARDPITLLSSMFSATTPRTSIVCGRPWNTFENIQEFPEYIGNNASKYFNVEAGYELMETIAEGYTFYGMCNTGMYFIPADVVKPLTEAALRYLQLSLSDPHYRYTIPFAPNYFGIDSTILWAAQYELETDIILAPPALNYIAAAENYLIRFLPELVAGISISGGTSETCGTDGSCDVVDTRSPALIHFSQGSSLAFSLDEGAAGAPPQCSLKMKAQLNPADSPLRDTIEGLFSGGETQRSNCDYFLDLLVDMPLDNKDSCELPDK